MRTAAPVNSPARERILNLILVAQVLPLVAQAVAEAIAFVLHVRGVELPAALECIVSASSSLLAAMTIFLILADRSLYRSRSLAPTIFLSVTGSTEKMDSDPDAWTQWRQVQSFPSVSSVASNKFPETVEELA